MSFCRWGIPVNVSEPIGQGKSNSPLYSALSPLQLQPEPGGLRSARCFHQSSDCWVSTSIFEHGGREGFEELRDKSLDQRNLVSSKALIWLEVVIRREGCVKLRALLRDRRLDGGGREGWTIEPGFIRVGGLSVFCLHRFQHSEAFTVTSL